MESTAKIYVITLQFHITFTQVINRQNNQHDTNNKHLIADFAKRIKFANALK